MVYPGFPKEFTIKVNYNYLVNYLGTRVNYLGSSGVFISSIFTNFHFLSCQCSHFVFCTNHSGSPGVVRQFPAAIQITFFKANISYIA